MCACIFQEQVCKFTLSMKTKSSHCGWWNAETCPVQYQGLPFNRDSVIAHIYSYTWPLCNIVLLISVLFCVNGSTACSSWWSRTFVMRWPRRSSALLVTAFFMLVPDTCCWKTVTLWPSLTCSKRGTCVGAIHCIGMINMRGKNLIKKKP